MIEKNNRSLEKILRIVQNMYYITPEGKKKPWFFYILSQSHAIKCTYIFYTFTLHVFIIRVALFLLIVNDKTELKIVYNFKHL